MAAKAQIGFSILILLFLFLIGDSLASPQMCNQFVNCTVNINVCKTKCNTRYHGRLGFCISTAPASPPTPPPALLQPMKLSRAGKKAYRCNCTFQKKPRQNCPGTKQVPVAILNKA
ncbi:uncharacterized protein LOC105171245 [Sesamum indicum]|uniref:Uncharacterized protein LOC105171245 n=1 Tax=Sesamum indicum TaxID=4182 RepID=A0A6I9TUH7_SESIN|nr:uncharacterized protein LOC105171245 [Sesamum indicum]